MRNNREYPKTYCAPSTNILCPPMCPLGSLFLVSTFLLWRMTTKLISPGKKKLSDCQQNLWLLCDIHMHDWVLYSLHQLSPVYLHYTLYSLYLETTLTLSQPDTAIPAGIGSSSISCMLHSYLQVCLTHYNIYSPTVHCIYNRPLDMQSKC